MTGAGPPGISPIFADTGILVFAAERGHAQALAEIRAGMTYVTSNQFREFLDVRSQAQRAARKAFLNGEGIREFRGFPAWLLSQSLSFQNTFRRVAPQQGRGDAALAAFARETGYEAVTMDRRLYNYLTRSMPQLGVPVRRIQ
jgi:hypothetical protein